MRITTKRSFVHDMEDDFALRYVSIYPGVNSRTELVTLRWLWDKALNGMAPQYIADMLSFKLEGSHHLRSDDRFLLQIPRTNAKTLGDRAFKHTAPTIWNSLPIYIRH